jgi:hypothetical protein
MEPTVAAESRFPLSPGSLLGVHSAAAACCDVASDYPLAAVIVGSILALALLQIGLVAACMRLAPQSQFEGLADET